MHSPIASDQRSATRYPVSARTNVMQSRQMPRTEIAPKGASPMSFITQMPIELYAADAVKDFRIADTFDLGTARAMTWMSQLAYETDRDKIGAICGKMGISLVGEPIHGSAKTALPIASTYALVLDLRTAVVVSFAGTDPIVLANWVSDFDIRPGDGGAAEGFSEALRAVEFDILARLPADRPVVVTGHSLGAALAALMAQRLREISRDVAAVYTLGMPRPGREDFAAAYQASGLARRTFRLVHGDDIVPTVAPSFLGFRHVGWYVPADTGQKFSQPAGELGSDKPQFSEGIR